MKSAESIHPAILVKMVDKLYVDAMVMADEARTYFDGQCEADRKAMDVLTRMSFTCESLKVTTRLMHVIAWVLSQRAWHRGEISFAELSDPRHSLGVATPTDEESLLKLPSRARRLVEDSQSLYDRASELAGGAAFKSAQPAANPVRGLLSDLENRI